MNITQIILLVLGAIQTLHVGIIAFSGSPLGVIIFGIVCVVSIWWMFFDVTRSKP